MYVAIRAALPKMLREFETAGRGASIINMASIAGSIKGLPNRFVYGTSKAAVIGLTKRSPPTMCRRAFAATRSHPAPSTRLARRAYQRVPRPGRGAPDVHRAPADGRLAKPEEIAPLVVFLASDEAAFVTGNVYSCDGGMTI